MRGRSALLSIAIASVGCLFVAIAAWKAEEADKPFFGAMAGLVLFYAMLTAVNLVSAVRKARMKRNRPSNSPQPIHLSAATIADDLLPLMTPHVCEGAHVRILGFDSYYTCSKNGGVFLDGLASWLKRGARVDYLLLSTTLSRDVEAALLLLRANFSCTFHPRVLRLDERVADENVRALAEAYRTFHPTLLEAGSARALWVESFHDANSVYAYGVKFVSPAAMNDVELTAFEKYREDFDLLAQSARPLVAAGEPQPLAA